jgi:hypothetical protein
MANDRSLNHGDVLLLRARTPPVGAFRTVIPRPRSNIAECTEARHLVAPASLVGRRNLRRAPTSRNLPSSRCDAAPLGGIALAERSQGQADACDYSVPRALFFLRVSDIEAVDGAAPTARKVAPAIEDHPVSFGGDGEE